MMEKTKQQQQRQQRKINVPRKHLRLIILCMLTRICLKRFIGCSSDDDVDDDEFLGPITILCYGAVVRRFHSVVAVHGLI